MLLLLLQETIPGIPGTDQAAELVRQFGLAQGLLICLVVFFMLILGWLIYDFKGANNKQGAAIDKAVTLLEILVDRVGRG